MALGQIVTCALFAPMLVNKLALLENDCKVGKRIFACVSCTWMQQEKYLEFCKSLAHFGVVMREKRYILAKFHENQVNRLQNGWFSFI